MKPQELVKKWRDEAWHAHQAAKRCTEVPEMYHGLCSQADQLNECADELEKSLGRDALKVRELTAQLAIAEFNQA